MRTLALSLCLLACAGVSGACTGDLEDVSPDEDATRPDAAASSGDAAADAAASPDSAGAVDAAESADAAPALLRLMSFNIKHCDITSLEEVAGTINDETPDLVGLQEVDVNADRSGGVDQPVALGEQTGMTSVFGKAINLSGGGEYGLAILSRHPIVSSQRILLTSSGEQRILLVAAVEVRPGVVVDFAVTHLGLTSSQRLTQAHEIVAAIDPFPYPVVVGDMNEEASAPGVSALLAVLVDTARAAGFTFPAGTPTSRIDFILAWQDAVSAHVPAVTTSDHRPVVAVVPLP